jgi:REP-associated tyrosine transposase
MITSNHVHLLIKDTGPNVIADSMQLIAGRTAQERKKGRGILRGRESFSLC